MSETEILDEIDKLRRENGWKPRRRMSNNKAEKSGHENSDKQVNPDDRHSWREFVLILPLFVIKYAERTSLVDSPN